MKISSLTLSVPLLAGLAYANLLPRQAGDSDPCVTAAPCVSLASVDNSCTDDACFCPPAITLAPECASCYATVNATASALLISIASGCSSELAAGTTGAAPTGTASSGGSGADPCATIPACSSIFNAADICADDSCFCPTALALGSACSHCYATVNATLAADLSTAVSGCSAEGFSPAGATPTSGGTSPTDTSNTGSSSPVTAETVSPNTGTRTATNSAATPKSSSGASHDVFGFSPVFGIMLIALMASLLTVFG